VSFNNTANECSDENQTKQVITMCGLFQERVHVIHTGLEKGAGLPSVSTTVQVMVNVMILSMYPSVTTVIRDGWEPTVVHHVMEYNNQ